MKYSVIIPAYQCAKTIEETVNSVLNSGLSDFEIILINDGSTDSTAETCNSLAQKHNEVVCIHKENGGVSSARNRGIEKATGEYLLFMDSDDYYDVDGLKNACEICEKQNPEILVFGLSFDYYKDGNIYRSDKLIYPGEKPLSPSQWAKDFENLFQHNALSSACNKIFKAETIKENNIVFNKDIFLMEDFLFVLQYLCSIEIIHFLPEAIYHYRQPDDELRAFTRAERIVDLNTYLDPFCNTIEKLTAYLKNTFSIDFTEGEKVLFKLYSMLISQKAYYADEKTLKTLTATIKNSRFANYTTDDILINDLKNENYKAIIKRHKKIQLRHKIAVVVKKNPLYQKLRGN